MKIASKFIAVILLLGSYRSAVYSQHQDRALLQPGLFAKEQEFRVSDIATLLINQGFRLNFEDVELVPEDEITVATALKRWGSLDPAILSARQLYLLQRAKTLMSQGKAGMVVIDYDVQVIKGSDLAEDLIDVKQLLDRVALLVPGFSVSKSNGSWILARNDMNYSKVPELVIKDGTVSEAYQQLNDTVLKEAKLKLVSFQPLPYADDGDRRIALNLRNVDLHTALTRFAESLGHDVVWSISGPSGNRMISFSRLHESPK